MGIDRIGKGGAPPATPETQGAGPLEKKGQVEKAFSVERPERARAAAAAESMEATSSPLARLRAGEIDVDGYLDLKVDEATKGLDGMPRADLAEIKRVLRDQMATDPGLTDLIRTATGQVANEPNDEG